MTTPTQKKMEPAVQCAQCEHFDFEHGTTGTRPCLATVGNVLDSDFCPCDAFRAKAAETARAA